MDITEIIERLKNIAEHAVHKVGERPFIMSLDDGIAVHEAIELLKKAETNCPEIPDSSDAISRQDAIEAINLWLYCDKDERMPADVIKALPPVRTEIIHCKDCKHWIPYDWMFSEVWQSQNMADYPEDEIGCNYCDIAMKANDFCSRAEKRGEADGSSNQV